MHIAWDAQYAFQLLQNAQFIRLCGWCGSFQETGLSDTGPQPWDAPVPAVRRSWRSCWYARSSLSCNLWISVATRSTRSDVIWRSNDVDATSVACPSRIGSIAWNIQALCGDFKLLLARAVACTRKTSQPLLLFPDIDKAVCRSSCWRKRASFSITWARFTPCERALFVA